MNDAQVASCVGKHRFDNGKIARQVAQRGRRIRDRNSAAYKCASCGGWHIGTSYGGQTFAKIKRGRR